MNHDNESFLASIVCCQQRQEIKKKWRLVAKNYIQVTKILKVFYAEDVDNDGWCTNTIKENCWFIRWHISNIKKL